MSTGKRIISGSIASWLKIIATFFIQIVLVPVYLSYWSVSVYGIWIAIQALSSVLAILDISHQNYLGFEFLKFGDKEADKISRYLSSAVLIGLMSGFLQLILLAILIYFYDISFFLSNDIKNVSIISEAGNSLFVLSIVWLLTGNIGGMLCRALYPFGYYARASWWGVLSTIIISIAPLISIINHKGLFITCLAQAFGTLLYNFLLYVDFFRFFKKIGITFIKPSLRLGWQNFVKSLVLSFNDLLNISRQQGVRLILSPLAGVNALVAFTTMRTGANIALQGLGTLTGPLMPELMRFLNEKNQEKCEVAFATVWTVLIVFLVPGIILIQMIMPSLFVIWTRGKIEYNPLLFALLSMTVLIYALAQPAIAIIKGNNNVKSQVRISFITALIVVGGMFLLVPKMGILGAAITLVIGELVDTQLYKIAAKKWLINNGLEWPIKTSRIAALSVLFSSITLGCLIYIPNFKWVTLIVAFILYLVIIFEYYKSFPQLVKEQINSIISKFLKIN